MLVLLQNNISVALLKDDDFELITNIIEDRYNEEDFETLKLIKADDIEDLELVLGKIASNDIHSVRGKLVDVKSLMREKKKEESRSTEMKEQEVESTSKRRRKT